MGKRRKRQARLAAAPVSTAQTVPSVADAPLSPISVRSVMALGHLFGGEKFLGGLMPSQELALDLHELRQRSWTLFHTNPYARGLIKRLVTNEIGPGLKLEAVPATRRTGQSENAAAAWSDDVEEDFDLWATDPEQVSHDGQRTFGQIQQQIRLNALIGGDVLVLLRYVGPFALPQIEVVDGSRVVSPLREANDNAEIIDGVELDEHGKQVAYWVWRDSEVGAERIPAVGAKSKRRLAWLVYGSGERRIGETRGVPLLVAVIQSLKDIDGYRDAEQRAALINAILALYVTREVESGPGTRPLSGGGLRKDRVVVENPTTGESRESEFSSWVPGAVFDALAPGEKIEAHNTSRPNVNFAAFEEAIVAAIAWSEEMPPEILRLSFSSNYSASRAAINEFNQYLKRKQADNSAGVTRPVYEQWLFSMVLARQLRARGLAEAWGNPRRRALVRAWTRSEWSGPIKPSVDPVKEIKAQTMAIEAGLTTRERAAADFSGLKYDAVVKRQKGENAKLKEARAPLEEEPANDV